MGASGDLAKKKTYPALFALWKANLLPPETVIWGFARTPKASNEFRLHLMPYLVETDNNQRSSLNGFLQRCFYRRGNSYADLQGIFSILKENPGDNILVYLAIPPSGE